MSTERAKQKRRENYLKYKEKKAAEEKAKTMPTPPPEPLPLPDPNELDELTRRKLASKRWRTGSGRFYKIKNRKDKIVPFLRNRAQADFEKHRHTFNIILKSRRIGFSANECINVIDEVLWNPVDALIVAHTDDAAVKMFQDKIMVAWENYPLKQAYSVERNTSDSIRFGWGKKKPTDPQEYSSITVSVSGRSAGYSWVHISELGKICAKFPDKAREIISGTIPTIPIGGHLTIESTAEGDEGYFRDIFWHAWNRDPSKPLGPTEFKAHFYNWQWDDEEVNKALVGQPEDLLPYFQEYQKKFNLTDQEIWYYVGKWESLARDFNLLKQEYPTTPEEAFESAGSPQFNHAILDEMSLTQKRNPIREQNGWLIYEEPIPSHHYAIAGDPSEGLGRDNAAAVVMDYTPAIPRIVATFKNNRTSPDDLGYHMVNVGKMYNMAFLCPLLNNHGHLTTYIIKKNYPDYLIFKQVNEATAVDKYTEKLGFSENMSSKAMMVGEFTSAINEKAVYIPSGELISELKTYQKENLENIKTEKEKSGHWDLATAAFACYQMRKYLPYSHNIKTYFAPTSVQGYNDDGETQIVKPQVSDPYSAV